MWPFKRQKTPAAQSGNVNAYFIRVGNAMAGQIFDLISHQCKGEGVLVRLLSADYVTAEARAGSGDAGEQFAAVTYYDDMLLKPEAIKTVKDAFGALSPSYDTETSVVLIVADEKWGTNARSWVQTFNSQYMKVGAPPIVRLVICQNASSGAWLSACFDLAKKDPAWEKQFLTWCAASQMDPGLWNSRD